MEKISVFFSALVLVLAMMTAGVFSSSGVSYAKTEASGSGSSSNPEGSNNEKSSDNGGSNPGNDNNNDNTSPDPGSTLKEATPVKQPNDVNTIPPTEETKKSDEKPTCLIPEGCGQNPNPNPQQPIAPPPLIPTAPPKEGGPDHECLFKPELPKCKSDNGVCPPGFNQNEDGNCFPKHDRCPKGFHSHEDDETGRCITDRVPCEPGYVRDPSFPTCNSKSFVCKEHPQTKGCNSNGNEDAGRCLSGRELRKDFCIRVILDIHHSSSSNGNNNNGNNNPNHSISDKCFSQIKIAWLAKIQRGQNSQVDSIINNCLGIK